MCLESKNPCRFQIPFKINLGGSFLLKISANCMNCLNYSSTRLSHNANKDLPRRKRSHQSRQTHYYFEFIEKCQISFTNIFRISFDQSMFYWHFCTNYNFEFSKFHLTKFRLKCVALKSKVFGQIRYLVIWYLWS